jgi:transposase-like protein
VGQKQGASALGLNRVIGIGSYKTAWTWMHKLRRAMVRPGRDRLAGTVEVDETYVGGSRPGKRGRGAENKTVVAVAAQVDGKGIGRIRLRRVQDASAVSLGGFVRESIVLGSNIVTDGWGSYESMDGYKHKARIIKDSQKSASTLLPRVHQVVSLFKRWLMGTHQGAVAAEHLDYYLDEFTFRFNRRTSRHRGKLFYRLIQQAVAVPPSPYREMIRGVRPKKRQKRKI